MKYLRGHHLKSLAEFYRQNGVFGNNVEQLYSRETVRITDTVQDELCDNCPGKNFRCSSSILTADDRRLAREFGLRIGHTYSFRQLQEIIVYYVKLHEN